MIRKFLILGSITLFLSVVEMKDSPTSRQMSFDPGIESSTLMEEYQENISDSSQLLAPPPSSSFHMALDSSSPRRTTAGKAGFSVLGKIVLPACVICCLSLIGFFVVLRNRHRVHGMVEDPAKVEEGKKVVLETITSSDKKSLLEKEKLKRVNTTQKEKIQKTLPKSSVVTNFASQTKMDNELVRKKLQREPRQQDRDISLLELASLNPKFSHISSLSSSIQVSPLVGSSPNSYYVLSTTGSNSELSVRPLAKSFSLIFISAKNKWSLLHQVFESLKLQRTMPDEVVLVVSDYRDSTKPSPDDLLESFLLEVPLNEFCESLPPASTLFMYVRRGRHTSGSNRQFGHDHSTGELISLFDGDDFLHPLRVEVLEYFFNNHPEIDLIIHDFLQTSPEDFNDPQKQDSKVAFLSLYPIPYKTPSFFPPSKIRSAVPSLPEGMDEPNWNKNTYIWYFARDMKLTWPEDNSQLELSANGWPSYRRSRLQGVVTYPDMSVAEDGLFIWRAIHNELGVTSLRMKLGAYVLGDQLKYWKNKKLEEEKKIAPET